MGDEAARTILVVDDEHSIVDALSELLGWEGYVVRAAANGREALEVLAAEAVDLVLLDVMMPVMDGLQAVRAIRADPRLAGTAVVLMSAAPIPAPADGWDAALQKPFELRALTDTVAAALTGRRRAGGA